MPYQQIAYDNIGQVKNQLQAHAGKLFCLGRCGENLSPDDLKGYPDYEHEGGIMITETGKRYWLYLHCPNDECDYDSALWKFRIEGLE